MVSQRSRRKQTTQTYRTLLITYLRPQWRSALLMAFLLLASIGLQLLNPQLLRSFIDTALSHGPYRTLMLLGGLFIAISLINQGISVAATYMSERVAWMATNWLRRDLVTHCLTLDMTFHQAYSAGALIERIDGDTETLSNFFSQALVHFVGNLLLLVGIVVLLFREDWRLGLAMALFMLISLLVLMSVNALGVPYWKANRQQSADFFGFLGEHLEGTEEVRANGATPYVLSRFFVFLRNWLPVRLSAGLTGFFTFATTLTIFAFGNALAFLLGAYLLSLHSITLGTVYLIFYYTNLIAVPVEQIRTQLQELQTAQAGIERIQELLHIQSALKDGGDGSIPDRVFDVDFRHVTFGYQANEPVLHDVTFHLAQGKVLGLLGHTGSGKTTLGRLLVRFYDIQQGEITLGGMPIAGLPLQVVRQHVGMVTQDVQLFRGTVRDNLTFFDRSVADAQIIDVLQDIGLTRWYAALPQGLDSEIGAGGEGLSAGESQLLACARVFFTNPGLVILDEASSRLDLVTEQAMERAIQKLLEGRTAIIIAHRLSTVQFADEIMILQDGHIIEHGLQKTLRADPTSRFVQVLATGLKEEQA